MHHPRDRIPHTTVFVTPVMMDTWMDGWMDGLTDGWMDGWMEREIALWVPHEGSIRRPWVVIALLSHRSQPVINPYQRTTGYFIMTMYLMSILTTDMLSVSLTNKWIHKCHKLTWMEFDRSVDVWTDGWMDGWMDGLTDGWMDWQMDGWMDGWTDGWRDGRTDNWMNGWMDDK